MNIRILVVGASGMLGYSLFRELAATGKHEVHGTVRAISGSQRAYFPVKNGSIHEGVDVHDFTSLEHVVESFSPNVVINCVGVIKQLSASKVPIESVSINSLLPHKLAETCTRNQAKLIHFSTDCVFSGAIGAYKESDLPDATDLYGRSKLLGEVDYGGHLTLRTSIIGHELTTSHSLIDWFLAQKVKTRGFRKAIFSGLPTVEIARILDEYVLNNSSLTGLLHLSAQPINKYDLLCLIRDVYGNQIEIEPSDELLIDRSLLSQKFRQITQYMPPSWPELVRQMHAAYTAYYKDSSVVGKKL